MNIRQRSMQLSKKLLIAVLLLAMFTGITNTRSANARGAFTKKYESTNKALLNSVIVYFGESDSGAIAKLPDLSLAMLVSVDEAQSLPRLKFESSLLTVQGQPAYEISDTINMPDNLLLDSNGYYGERLAMLSAQIGLDLSEQQLQAMSTISAVKGINTRYLLTLAKIKNADKEFSDYQNWLKWLYLETSRVRSALFFVKGETQVIQFYSREIVVIQLDEWNLSYRAIFTSLSAGQSKSQAEKLSSQFIETYIANFGNPFDEIQPANTTPFLYKPYNVQLQGRGYYDHTYPSVDVGSPNIGGMLDYLGRTNTNYDMHDGDDFWMPIDTEVFAPLYGQVVDVEDWGAGNKGIIIQYNGYEIVIWHLNKVYVSSWQWVSLGQSIGTSGYAGGVNHIHFEVRHGGKQTDTMGWYGGGNDPCPEGPSGVPGGIGVYKGCEVSSWLWADENPPDFTGPSITVTQQPVVNQWYDTDQNIVWAISDPGSGVRGYKYAWDQNPPTGTEISGATGSVSLPQGIHTLYIQAWDNAGNVSDIASAGPFWFDNIVPTSSPTISTGIAGENGWYLSAVNVLLLATDNGDGSGVSQTQYKIDAGNWQTYSAPFSVSTNGFHRVYYKSQDIAGNWETEKNTLVKIDSVSPTGSFVIQNGSPQTYSTTTVLNSQASDVTSGVSRIRFRDVGGTWSAWLSYSGVLPWQLIGSHGQTASVEAQFKDGAGNVSTVVSDSITINLYPANPSSTLYVLKRTTFGAVGMNSDSPQYTLNGTAGQPSIPGVMQGTNYRLSSGYWASSIKAPPIFADVPAQHWAWGYIERLYNAGVTGGCSTAPLKYCPENQVTRGQMAVFLLKGMYGKDYVAPAATGTVFNDVPVTHMFARWIEQLAAEGITGGCGNGNYCPNSPVNREQMAVFLLVAEHGVGYAPPAASGVFSDVPAANPYAAWIEQLAAEGITGGCGGGKYCPKQVVNRAQMAVFL
ncbi:MAG: S-layer homology domain-containing protein, partial [Chloroflexi bacterium]|nr:S-layer homology domain-containing protein [Chloroflexota bacterium]